jgi:cyanophycin synthetase
MWHNWERRSVPRGCAILIHNINSMRNYGLDRYRPLAPTMIGLLCVYYFIVRAVRSQVQPGVKRMRALRKDFYESMWRSAAAATGGHFSSLPNGVAEVRRGGRRMTVCANKTSLDDGATVERAADKLKVNQMLAKAGIPVPRHIVIEIGEFDKALRMLQCSRLPLVVKPAANTGAGAGVSTNVTTPRRLRAAVAWARAYGRRILVEEQVQGDCYRVLVMDGEVLDTVVRHPPRVIGDGVSTVQQLMRQENRLRRQAGAVRAQVLVRPDPELRNTLSSQGLTLHSRPAKGEVVVLKRVVNDNGTWENASANNCVCSAILECARKAADIVGARLAGVDLICRDPQVPLEQSGGAVIEVNANPGLYYHYHANDSGFPVAEIVMNKFFNGRISQTDIFNNVARPTNAAI